MTEVSAPPKHVFDFLQLPYEIRQQIYNYALSTTISITDSRLSHSPTLEEISFLASRRGAWNLSLCSRLIYFETTPLLWDNLTIALAKDGTSFDGDNGRHRLGNADQAFRRKIRHIIVSDPACYGLCYGMTHCFHLKTLTVHVGKIDGIFLEKDLMSPKPTGAVHKPKGRKLRLEIEQMTQPRSTAAGMVINSGKSGLGQIEWRREWAARGERFRFMFLSDLIPTLPQGCRITLQVRVLEVTMRVLWELDGFTISSAGKHRWAMSYDEDV
jgi:hypothetical protein